MSAITPRTQASMLYLPTLFFGGACGENPPSVPADAGPADAPEQDAPEQDAPEQDARVAAATCDDPIVLLGVGDDPVWATLDTTQGESAGLTLPGWCGSWGVAVDVPVKVVAYEVPGTGRKPRRLRKTKEFIGAQTVRCPRWQRRRAGRRCVDRSLAP